MEKTKKVKKEDDYVKGLKRENASMRKKLYSALTMLLVASLLITGVSYAWLTMSISPEASDIAVTVTGNGSLEIALATTESIANLGSIRSSAGDSGYTELPEDGSDRVISYSHDANTKWGNLIDLSNDYGLDEVVLYPSMLNIANGHILNNPLKIADYGADGRITTLDATTASATYDKATQSFLTAADSRYGVRALGVVADTGLWKALINTVNVAGDLSHDAVDTSAVSIYDCIMLHEDPDAEPVDTDEAMNTLGALVEAVGDLSGEGWIANLDAAIRELIVACSGYSEQYVSVASSKMTEISKTDISTVDIINEYVLDDTDLAEFCGIYLQILEKADAAKEAYAVMLERAAADSTDISTAAEPSEGEETDTEEVKEPVVPLPDKLTWDDIKDVLVPLTGDSFTYEYTSSYIRTAKRPNPNDETKTITSTDYDTIKKGSAAEVAAVLEELNELNEDIGETEVNVSHHSETRYINVDNDDCVVSMIATLTGSVYSVCGNVTESELEFAEVLRAYEPEKGSAAANLGAVQRATAYSNAMLDLQTLWNELPAQRSALETALYAELAAVADIYEEKKTVENHNSFIDENYSSATAALEAELAVPPKYVTPEEKTEKINEAIQKNETANIERRVYTSPESADINKLVSHLTTFENVLDFYDAYTRASVLAYASKSTTPYDTYSRVSKALKEIADLEDVIAALGVDFSAQYSAALSDYNMLNNAVTSARRAVKDYYLMLAAEEKAKENGEIIEEVQHPTAEEDIALRRAFVDIDSLSAEYTTAPEGIVDGLVVYDGETLFGKLNDTFGMADTFRSYNSEFYPAYSYKYVDEENTLPLWSLGYSNYYSDNADAPMTDLINLLYNLPSEEREPIRQISDELNSFIPDSTEWIETLRYYYKKHAEYASVDVDVRTALGLETEEKYSLSDLTELRTALRKIKTVNLQKAKQLVKYGLTEYFNSLFSEAERNAVLNVAEGEKGNRYATVFGYTAPNNYTGYFIPSGIKDGESFDIEMDVRLDTSDSTVSVEGGINTSVVTKDDLNISRIGINGEFIPYDFEVGRWYHIKWENNDNKFTTIYVNGDNIGTVNSYSGFSGSIAADGTLDKEILFHNKVSVDNLRIGNRFYNMETAEPLSGSGSHAVYYGAEKEEGFLSEVKYEYGELTETLFSEALNEIIDKAAEQTEYSDLGSFIISEMQASRFDQIQKAADRLLSDINNSASAWKYLEDIFEDYDVAQLLWNEANQTLTSMMTSNKASKGYTWEDIGKVLAPISGYNGEYFYDDSYHFANIYLPDGSVYERFAALFSDKTESELYNSRGGWGYYENNSIPGELDLRLFGLSKKYDDEYASLYDYWLELEYANGGVYYCVTPIENKTTDYRQILVRTNNFTADNAITPLYELATADTKIETDRSALYARLRGRMDSSRGAMLAAYENIDLSSVAEYLNKALLYGATIDPSLFRDKDGKIADLTAEERRDLLPANTAQYGYAEILGLRASLGTLDSALTAYENNLKLEFMVWAASSNGTKKVYNAVLKNYTEPLSEILDASGVSSGNVYYDTYQTLAKAQKAIRQSMEMLDEHVENMAALGGSTNNQFILASNLYTALSPLADDYFVLTTITFPEPEPEETEPGEEDSEEAIDALADEAEDDTGDEGEPEKTVTVELKITDSVIGDVLSLYSDTVSSSYTVAGETVPNTDEDGEALPTKNVTLPVSYISDGNNSMKKTEEVTVSGGANRWTEAAANTTSSSVMTDAYAIALDLIFRTNVEGASLLLQTDAAQRIYSEKTADNAVGASTLGGGSTISYERNGVNSTTLEKFNNALRVVFADTRTGEVLACAKSYITAETAGDSTVVGQLYLCDYTITDSGVIKVGDKADSAAIKPLNKNTATPVSAYIYIDGNAADNSAVPTLGDMKINMNLQFATDVDLTPAQYAPLKNNGTNG